MVNTKKLVAVAAIIGLFSAGAEAKLYKWVDDKGETHYGEVIPPEYADKDRVRFDDKGREIKQQETKKKEVKDQATIDQERRDQSLLGTFSSESEIDLARDRNLQQVEAHVNSVNLRMKTAQEDLDGLNKEKDAAVKAGKPVHGVLQEQLDQATTKLNKLKDELSKTEAEAKAVRERYDADKQRYRELTGKADKGKK